MKRLYISLVVMALLALFFISRALDTVSTSTNDAIKDQEFGIYQRLIEGFSNQLNLTPSAELQSYFERLTDSYQIEGRLAPIATLALPAPLLNDIQEPGGLLLASETGAYIVRALDSHPSYLITITVPNPEVHTGKDILLTMAFYLGIGFILLLWLLPLTRRLNHINRTATAIGHGKLDNRIKVSRFSYIISLEQNFNRMAQQIEHLVAENKMLSGSLSHDLRTPIACLRFGIDAALDAESADEKDELIERMEQDLTQMEEMVTAFLQFANFDQQSKQRHMQKVNIQQIIDTVCRQTSVLAEEADIRFDCRTSGAMGEMTADQIWLTRALVNLTSNGIRYARGALILRCHATTNKLRIEIEDDGPGIDKSQWELVFKPFTRLEESRNRQQGHFGLGLAIVQKVVTWHQGEIKIVEPSELCGCRFVMTLPRR
ncbi:sensor histidine kinase [Thaumasiovibrio subtropicus]|uniref:sensor histidine kinase n=1 Tax=Thaumasiovibrio subtropicus TaxID=1891207 RepID=UPI000B34E67A|nr:ATP-binding protein [Thaumasiovibrio subtropicus]